MIAFEQLKDWAKWLEQVKALAGEDFDYFCDWYSFETAFKEGMTPEAAYKDCAEWMES